MAGLGLNTQKQEAQELPDRLKAEAWQVKNLGDKPRYTWQDAVVRWFKEQCRKKSIADDKMHLRWLDPYLGNLMLHSITRGIIDELVIRRKQEGVSNATVNRMLAVVRAILRRAALDWEWLDKVPARTQTAGSLAYARRSSPPHRGIAGTFGRDGAVYLGNRFAASQCHAT